MSEIGLDQLNRTAIVDLWNQAITPDAAIARLQKFP